MQEPEPGEDYRAADVVLVLWCLWSWTGPRLPEDTCVNEGLTVRPMNTRFCVRPWGLG